MQIVKNSWIVVLPWKSFPMCGAPCTREEALASARLIWWNAEIDE